MAQFLHAYATAQDSDRLPAWAFVAIAVTTIGAGLVLEANRYRRTGKVMVGFRSGVLLGLLASSMATGTLAYASWRVLVSGAVKCMRRHCHGFNFTDLLGHRHHVGENLLSMTFQPLSFWFSYAEISLFTTVALFALFGCIRSAVHWRELE